LQQQDVSRSALGWTWLALPVVFGVAFRIALWVYWRQERSEWITSHGGDPASAAYGDGIHYGLAILSMKWPLLLSVVCCGVAAGPRLLSVVVMGLISAAGAVAVGMVSGAWLGGRFGSFSTIHASAAAATSIVLASYFAQQLLIRGAKERSE